jgi:hypothetical protein
MLRRSLLFVALASAAAEPVRAQTLAELTATPEATADAFLRSVRAIGAMIDDMPGLMHALYDRDDEVLGAVGEGADSAHVVYPTLARIGGAVPEVKVMVSEHVAQARAESISEVGSRSASTATMSRIGRTDVMTHEGRRRPGSAATASSR